MSLTHYCHDDDGTRDTSISQVCKVPLYDTVSYHTLPSIYHMYLCMIPISLSISYLAMKAEGSTCCMEFD